MNEQLINELRSIELFAEDLRQKCYKARKRLEGLYPPATSPALSSRLTEEQTARLLAQRRKNILRSLK